MCLFKEIECRSLKHFLGFVAYNKCYIYIQMLGTRLTCDASFTGQAVDMIPALPFIQSCYTVQHGIFLILDFYVFLLLSINVFIHRQSCSGDNNVT